MIWTYLDLEVRHFFKMYNSDTSNYNNFRPPCPFRTQQWILAPIAISQQTNRQPHLTLKPMLECGTLRGRKPSVAFRPTWANVAPFMCGAQWMREVLSRPERAWMEKPLINGSRFCSGRSDGDPKAVAMRSHAMFCCRRKPQSDLVGPGSDSSSVVY